jgi:hypothetical protein
MSISHYFQVIHGFLVVKFDGKQFWPRGRNKQSCSGGGCGGMASQKNLEGDGIPRMNVSRVAAMAVASPKSS